MGTTANRVGLERFFEVVWPALSQTAQLWVVGDISQATPPLARSLAGANCTGFVKDLGAVLRPYDLHIIPWEQSTGQRTRMVQAFNYAQVVVAVRASVAGFPEAIDGQNCRLVERLDQMAEAVRELIDNPAERERLGRAARETFERSFTRHSLLPRYEAVISSLC
jgi:glycosyltransferase involved in cell wall biosynthesis